MLQLNNSGNPASEIIREYDLSSGTLYKWVPDYDNSGSFKKEDNLTDEQKHLIELQKENKELRMEIDILKQAAMPPVPFEFRGIENR